MLRFLVSLPIAFYCCAGMYACHKPDVRRAAVGMSARVIDTAVKAPSQATAFVSEVKHARVSK